MGPNKHKSENFEELKIMILKETQTTIDIFLQEKFNDKLEEFIVKKIEEVINKKFDEVFHHQFEEKVTKFLEDNFNFHDLSLLNDSLERRLKEILLKIEIEKKIKGNNENN